MSVITLDHTKKDLYIAIKVMTQSILTTYSVNIYLIIIIIIFGFTSVLHAGMRWTGILYIRRRASVHLLPLADLVFNMYSTIELNIIL